MSSELQQLAELKDNGILTDEEFETQKHKLLNQ
ncbi:SHOCT domain-containing protein [uncultured Weissella sp.]|nr:SHOCT domain-containing protein [uncultured Weissella sp.]